MASRPLTVAWFSFFPVERLPDLPEPLRDLTPLHPASWQRVLLAELENVPSLRLHVVVLRKQFRQNFTFERNGVVFHLIKVPGGVRAPSLFWVDTLLIGRVLKKVKPDVVHAWGTEQGAALVANRLGYPRVVTIQGLMSWYGEVVPLNWHERLAGVIERYTLPRVPLVTTESRFSVQWLRQKFPNLRVEQIEHAPDPVFHRVQRQPQTNPLRFIFVGAFDYRKGGDLLLSALDELKDEFPFELVAVGRPESPFLESLQARVSPGLWQRVIFKEQLTYHQVAAELGAATMMICPTRADVSPNAVKEAVVAGVPVVGSAVGGIPDYVFPGENGLLFPAGRLGELINTLRTACRHPLFSRGKVEPASLEKTRAYLSPELMGRRFQEAYQLAFQREKG
jgi:glycosyltransferase involved in cell wall biosynthesis